MVVDSSQIVQQSEPEALADLLCTGRAITPESPGNAVKDFIAERRKPSGVFMTQTHRRARALPLETLCFCGEKSFTALSLRDAGVVLFWTVCRVTVCPLPESPGVRSDTPVQ